MDKIVEKLKELLDNCVQKLLALIVIPVLPLLALYGKFNATGNYWWDSLIVFGITGLFYL